MRLSELFLRVAFFGAEWTLWVLMALSILSISVILERAFYFFSRRLDVDLLMSQIQTAVRAGKFEQALRITGGSRAPECIVLQAGLEEFRRGAHAAGEAMASAKARVRLSLEARLGVLATLGSNSPFIGLLGTVLGIITASHELTQAQGTQEAASSTVMAGVFEALVATAVGLFVAIPAVIAFNVFQRIVRRTLGRIDVLAHWLLSLAAPDAPAVASEPAKLVREAHVR